MRNINPNIRRLFELALPENLSKCGDFFAPFEATSEEFDKLRFERQTFSQWKVQREFQKLHYRQRTRAKKRIIYILPIGPFPSFVLEKIPGLKTCFFELLSKFVAVFYLGLSVQIMDFVDLNEIFCKTRIHPGTGKLQVLVGDVLSYLKDRLPKDGYCVIGILWVDLYPGDEWNFVLGEASSEDGCAAISFGQHEPKASEKLCSLNTLTNKNQVVEISRQADGINKAVECSNLQSSSNEQIKEHSKLNLTKNGEMNHAKNDDSKLVNNWNEDDPCSVRDEKMAQDHGNCCEEEPNKRIMDINDAYCSSGSTNKELKLISLKAPPCTKNSHQEVALEGEMHNSVECTLDVANSGQENCKHFENNFGRIERIDAFEIWKFFRVVSHELGHLFGLTHCSYFSCAMNESNSIDEAVNQPLFMCPVCLRKIQKATGFDVVERYTRLQHFLESLHSDLVQEGQQGKSSDVDNIPLSESRDNFKELQRFSMAVDWIDSVLKFLKDEYMCQ